MILQIPILVKRSGTVSSGWKAYCPWSSRLHDKEANLFKGSSLLG